mmetsp:Transcript_39221/g.57660  ORF Transcript_39221/g.57660 Transcript_39221/m.57660 type:complete len:98 (-) Transcript_39221:1263-1556(-)
MQPECATSILVINQWLFSNSDSNEASNSNEDSCSPCWPLAKLQKGLRNNSGAADDVPFRRVTTERNKSKAVNYTIVATKNSFTHIGAGSIELIYSEK